MDTEDWVPPLEMLGLLVPWCSHSLVGVCVYVCAFCFVFVFVFHSFLGAMVCVA